MNKNIKSISLQFILLVTSATPIFSQNNAVDFWGAVTPQRQPYEQRKLEQCLEKISRLPLIPAIKKSGTACPPENIPDNSPDFWTGNISTLRRKGYRNCCIQHITSQLEHTPDSNFQRKVDLYVQYAYTLFYYTDYHRGDSIANIAIHLSEKLPYEHAGAKYIAALASYRNLRTETVHQQANTALLSARKERNQLLEMLILSLLGNISRDVFIGHNLTAIPDHEQALKLAKSLKDTSGIINELIALGLNYGDAQQMNRHFDYLSQALDYLQHYENVSCRLRLMIVLANDLGQVERLQEALDLGSLAIDYADAVQSIIAADFRIRVSGLYMTLHQYDKVRDFLNRAADIYHKAGMDAPAQMGGLYQAFYALEKVVGNEAAALHWLEKSYATVSLNYTQRNAELLSRFETAYKTGEKEKMLQAKDSLLKITVRQRTLILIFAMLVSLFGTAVLVGFFRQRKARFQLAQQNEIIRFQSEELKKLEELKSRFFANVSHELRTPLTLMLGPVHSLLRRMEDKGSNYQLLQLVQRNGKRLQELVNEILDLAKLEAGKLEIMPEPVVFLPFLQHQIAQFDSDSSFDKIKFILDCQTDPDLTLSLDKNKMEKIIQNFLSNSIKYTPKGGKVTLRAKDLGAQIEVSVADTGIGIHPNDLPYIFDRFYQSRQIEAKTEGGTGIGLSLCRELAMLMGGNTWATSEPGKGSIFYFVFPKKIDAHQPIAMDKGNTTENSTVSDKKNTDLLSRRIQPGSSVKTRILIVEDNPDLQKYLQFILADFDTITAENGMEALKLMYDRPGQMPQLILSDIMMPVMDGFELLEKIKSDDRSRHLPVIMLTAKTNSQTKLQALRVGVDDYLTKPFEEAEILARIDNLLNNYRERMAFFSRQGAAADDNAVQPNAVISAFDNQWLQEVESVFFKHISESHFNMEWAASVLFISKRQLDRRLLQLTGLTSAHYLREIRLQKAWEYLQQRKFSSIKEIAHQVGFQDSAYFSTLFHKRYGTLPSTML